MISCRCGIGGINRVARKESVMSEVTKSSIEFDLPSSVQIERNTKGYNWTIKLRCEPGQEVALVDQIESLDKLLRSKFGGGSA